MKYKAIAIFLTICLVQILACSSPKSEPNAELLIPRDTMIQLLAEEHLFQAFAKIREDRNLKGFKMNDAYAWILRTHQVSDTAFKYSVDYYASDPKEFEAIYDAVIVRLSEMQADLQSGNN